MGKAYAIVQREHVGTESRAGSSTCLVSSFRSVSHSVRYEPEANKSSLSRAQYAVRYTLPSHGIHIQPSSP